MSQLALPGSSAGSRAQTFAEARRVFSFSVDAQGDGQYVDIVDPPYVEVVGGPAAELVAVAPSTVVVGRPFRLLIRAQDAWISVARREFLPTQVMRPILTLSALVY